MTDTQYDEALRLLREQASTPADGGEATRMRILAALHMWETPRKHRTGVWVAAAACLATSIALAYYVASQAEHPTLPAIGAAPLGASMKSEPAARVAQTKAEPESVSAALEVAAPEHESTPSREPAARPRSTRALAPRSANHKVEPTAPPSTPGSVLHAKTQEQVVDVAPKIPAQPGLSEPERHALYMTAHRLQFRGAPSAALAAWDAYLAAAPEGPLLAEARYNRAVILLRLSRHDEAREALEPFARGDYAGFRQADARRFLADMPGSSR